MPDPIRLQSQRYACTIRQFSTDITGILLPALRLVSVGARPKGGATGALSGGKVCWGGGKGKLGSGELSGEKSGWRKTKPGRGQRWQ